MARILQSRFPIDQQPSRAVGFGFPLNGEAVFVPTYFTRDQIKANLVNYLLTNRTTDDLKNTIQNDITQFFPNVEIKEIEFNNKPDENIVNFTLTYQIVNFGGEDSINILLQ